MKSVYKHTLITTLTLASFLFIILFYTQRETMTLLVENKQISMKRITDEIAMHLNTTLNEKLSLLTLLAQTPLLIENTQNNNQEYDQLTQEMRDEKIATQNTRWQITKDLNDSMIQAYLSNPSALYLKAQQKALQNQYDILMTINHYGVLIGSTKKSSTMNFADTFWWQTASNQSKSQKAIFDFGFNEKTHKYQLAITIPLQKEKNTIGLLRGDFNIDNILFESIQKCNKKSGATLKIIRKDGMIIKENQRDPSSIKLSNTLLSILNQTPLVSTASLQNDTDDTLFAISPIPITQTNDSVIFKQNRSTKTDTENEWYVVMIFPKSYFIAQTHPLFLFQLIVGSIGITLFSLLFFIWNQKRIKSINALTKEIYLLDIAHPNTPPLTLMTNELSLLIQALNTKINTIRHTTIAQNEIQKITQETTIQHHQTTTIQTHQQAIIDELTGIHNRKAFDFFIKKLIAQAKRYKEPLSLMLFSIDHYDEIIDTNTVSIGEEIVKSLAYIVQGNLREEDILFKWDNHIFMLVTPHITQKNATDLAERLRTTIASYQFEKLKHITVSFGVVELLDNQDTLELLLARINKALEQAQKKGNCVVSI